MSEESESPDQSPVAPKIQIVEYSPREFAASLKEFYDELIELGVEKEFAEKLTIAFCERP